MNIGDRITYSDMDRPDDCVSGVITDIFVDHADDPVAIVVQGDDGLWHTLDLRQCIIKPAQEAHH